MDREELDLFVMVLSGLVGSPVNVDIILVNCQLLQSNPTMEVKCLNAGISDHCPVMLNWSIAEQSPRKVFNFINAWTKHEDFLRVVSEAWDTQVRGNPMFIVV